MHKVVRTASLVYLAAAIWLTVLYNGAAALAAFLAPAYASAGLDPLARTICTMSLAMLAATTLAGLVVGRLRRMLPAAPDRVAARAVDAVPQHQGAKGQGLAEYALILGLIAVVAIAALTFLGTAVFDLMSMIGATVDSVT